MDLLIQAADAFTKLKKIKYRLILSAGRNKPMEEIVIDFCDTDFFHMLGFQYLTDIDLPKNKKKLLEEINNGSLSEETILKSDYYDNVQLGHSIKKRIEMVVNIERYLDSQYFDVSIFKNQHSICSKIVADYLIVCREMSSGDEYYIFIRKRKIEEKYSIVSCFPKSDRSYWGGKRYLMLKEKIEGGVSSELFKHKDYQNIPSVN